MTRRMTWVILLTVWAVLIAGSLTAYLTTRAVMLSHLDEALLDQVMSPRIENYRGRDYQILGGRHEGDITLITAGTEAEPHAELISARWVKLPGERYRRRSIVARVHARAVEGGEIESLVLPYSRQAYEFDPLMNRLAAALGVMTFVGGIGAAVLARVTAQTSLRPLKSTADVIGTIDDRSLDRRIDAERLPPELVPMAEKLNAMLERLDSAMNQRKQFLADASHELRTPVAALLTALELAARRPRQPHEYRQTLETCLADARHLRRLVEALMAQVKSEVSSPDAWEQVDLSPAIDECVRIVQPLAQQRSIRITTDVPSLPPLRTQPARLRSILINLLSNAVEYNHEAGSISVSVAHQNGAIALEVADTGPGIAEDKLAYVFEPFFRGDGARQASEHLGLGLFLVLSHVRALGGKCSVSSRVGFGTCFRIVLPAAGERSAEMRQVPQPTRV